jgi:hypothetical protein
MPVAGGGCQHQILVVKMSEFGNGLCICHSSCVHNRPKCGVAAAATATSFDGKLVCGGGGAGSERVHE